MKRLLILLLCIVSAVSIYANPPKLNVENLFDLRDDPQTNDDEFTPDGERHWTRKKFYIKCNAIA